MNDENPTYKGRGGWRGGGRPKVSDANKRNKQFAVVCTIEEKEVIKRNAEKANKTVSKYILDKIL